MKFNLEVYLKIDGTGLLSSGEFLARNKSQIPAVAYQFIESIKRETGYRITIIEKAVVNRSEDITEEIKRIDNQPIPDMDDIFW